MKYLAMLLWILISGCASCSSQDPSNPDIVIKDDINLCAPACTNVKDLGCLWGEDLVYPETCAADSTPCEYGTCIGGQCIETCEMICRDNANKGSYQNLECRLTIESCEEIETVCSN
jgi:hypothetical protein